MDGQVRWPYPGPVIPGSRRPLWYQPPPTSSLPPTPAVHATCRRRAPLALGDLDTAIAFYPGAFGRERAFGKAGLEDDPCRVSRLPHPPAFV